MADKKKIITVEDINGNTEIEIDEVKINGVDVPSVIRMILSAVSAIVLLLPVFGLDVGEVDLEPIGNSAVNTIMAILLIYNTWKNNSFTKNAKIADQVKDKLKEQGRE